MINVPGLSKAEVWGGGVDMLPPGEYAFEVEEYACGQSKNGVPQIELSLVVIGGAETDTLNGRKQKHWIYYGKSLGRLRAILAACEIPVDAKDNFDETAFPGRTFIAEVAVNTYEKDDLATGTKIAATNTKIQNERPMSAGWSNSEGVAAPTQPAAAAPAAPVQPAAPAATARATVPARASAPAARTAPLPRPASAGNLRAPNPAR
jgi:hypothetical protein